ncbi:nudC domain-containing protein 3 isoform X2 [Pseudomyrmex gracilis]|nr:nudC domain-containing protein 3 isoform X2 [Pseudomyrmex gracilis]
MQKIGFAHKEIDILVASTLSRWKDWALNSSRKRKLSTDNCKTNENNAECFNSTKETKKTAPCNDSDNTVSSAKSSNTDHTADSYNGAVRDNYVWTQTLTDLDVLVNIPEYVKSSSFLKVNITSDEIRIDVKSSDSGEDSTWKNLFNGKFSFKIRKDESMWSIVPGKQISIHLEKVTETWWDALIVNEPKIDLRQIDCSKNFDDMTPDEQMKVQELMWNHQQKLSGNETTDEKKNRKNIEASLKKAWDAEGSPFRGKPYDPSVLKFN